MSSAFRRHRGATDCLLRILACLYVVGVHYFEDKLRELGLTTCRGRAFAVVAVGVGVGSVDGLGVCVSVFGVLVYGVLFLFLV